MQKIKSPFKEFPGTISLPDQLDAEQFNQWWNRLNDIEDDEEETRHEVFQIWDCRFHFIQSNTIKFPEGYEIERTGLKLPTPVFAEWLIEQTSELLDQANDLKNYLGLSDNT